MIKLTMEEAMAKFGFKMTIDESKLTPFQKYELACKNFIWINNKYLVK
jgi:hypothetical protein